MRTNQEMPDRIKHLNPGSTVFYNNQSAIIQRMYYDQRKHHWTLVITVSTFMGPRTMEISSHSPALIIGRSSSMR